ncbi:type III secretion system export apparatus subunit SctT [Trinickia caryophylli]|uniref:Type III secretion protein T n=1 Tax=Trinickia caryophylli TaxID=28094 RepID=A0A1X7FJW2_TRICW|nr:type III secretion system export apparatus subunit SctT [Trinickia caryophylli]PMS13169.1 EscT/YscT/HrcT family type III secretion system export apparatus protein [Trinickia caryophylli]TRX19303.1 EscT/YscT/HrcT family type III secretion system export apparatus protein [Trinickia caryophylli]WQE13394.1 type III secretion system export apparatus subunit SctT [Trinickia caryophylli]SMF53488.1 type III secretion protein T [Trinickia caryophylli]GLU34087.1 EscT/YscT/HrcT family type III secreti
MLEQAHSFADIAASARPLLFVMPRLLPIMLIMPVFNEQIVTGLVRNGLAVVIAAFVAPVIDPASVVDLPFLVWCVLAAKEAVIGLLLAGAMGAVLFAIQGIGYLIDFQTGSGNAAFFDPMGGHESGPTSGFLNYVAIVLFVTAGGLQMIVQLFAQSYTWWPVAEMAPNLSSMLSTFVVRQTDTVFVWMVKLSAPVVIVLVLVEAGIGLIGRAVPQLNVFTFSQPVKSALAMLMMVLFMPLVYQTLHAQLNPDTGLVGMLRALMGGAH